MGPTVPLAHQLRGVPRLLEDFRDEAIGAFGVHQDAVRQRIERGAVTPLQLDQGRRVAPRHAAHERRIGNGHYLGSGKGQGRHGQ